MFFGQVAAGVRKLQEGCAKVFRLQLRSWCLHGRIVDPYGEFFLTLSDEKRAIIEPSRLPPWLLESNAESLRYSGIVLDEMRRREYMCGAEILEGVERVINARTKMEVDIAVSNLKEEAMRAIGSVIADDAVKALMSKVRDEALLGKGALWDAFLEDTGMILSDPKQMTRAGEKAGFEALVFGTYGDTIAPTFSPQWPLSEILSADDEKQYASIFGLLLPVRMAFHTVSTAWFPLQRRGRTIG